MFKALFNWLTGRTKYLAQIEKQMRLIEELQADKKEIITFLEPVKPGETEMYAGFISGVWSNRFFKWFLNDIDRAVVIKFKSGENADFCRGMMAAVDVFASKMKDISDSYLIKQNMKGDNE